MKYTDPTGLDGWGNDAADWLDERIEFARQWWQGDDQDWIRNGSVNSGADFAFGFSDIFRVRSGTAQAFCDCDENIYGRGAYLAMDVQRASGLFSILASPFAKAGIGSSNSCPKKTFLPDEYYKNKLNNRAPTQNAPFGMYDRFDANGNLHQTATYDAFGSRTRQFDVGPKARHGEWYHTFDYDSRYPRQNSGGGRRNPQINF